MVPLHVTVSWRRPRDNIEKHSHILYVHGVFLGAGGPQQQLRLEADSVVSVQETCSA